MSMTLIAQGSEIPLTLQLEDGFTGSSPQSVIVDDTGTILTTVDLSHQTSGLYINTGSAVTMSNNPFISATYIVYSDVGHATESNIYLRALDTFGLAASVDSASIADTVWNFSTESLYEKTGSAGQALMSLVGLVQTNFSMTEQTYDGAKRLLSARIKIFKSGSDATADTNPYQQYIMSSSYDGLGNLSSYVMVEG